MSACTQNPFLPENWSKPMSQGRGRPALSEDELDRTVEIYRQKGAAQAAEHFGIGIPGLYRRLKMAGVKPIPRPGRPRKEKAKKEPKVKAAKAPVARDLDLQMAALHQNGKSYQEIGDQFRVSRQRVQQRISRAKAAAVWSPADIQHYPEA